MVHLLFKVKYVAAVVLTTQCTRSFRAVALSQIQVAECSSECETAGFRHKTTTIISMFIAMSKSLCSAELQINILSIYLKICPTQKFSKDRHKMIVCVLLLTLSPIYYNKHLCATFSFGIFTNTIQCRQPLALKIC